MMLSRLEKIPFRQRTQGQCDKINDLRIFFPKLELSDEQHETVDRNRKSFKIRKLKQLDDTPFCVFNEDQRMMQKELTAELRNDDSSNATSSMDTPWWWCSIQGDMRQNTQPEDQKSEESIHLEESEAFEEEGPPPIVCERSVCNTDTSRCKCAACAGMETEKQGEKDKAQQDDELSQESSDAMC